MLRAVGAVGGGLPGNFWKLWASSASANLADGILVTALPLIAVGLTRSPAEVAGISAAAMIPMIVFGLPAGGLADRLDRRWTMVAVQVLRVTILAGLLVFALADGLSMPILYVAALIFGTGEAFFETNAQSLTPAVVGREHLVRANGRLFAAETVMNSFVGPPVGGLLIAISVPVALSGSLAGFALAALGLLLMRGRFRAERSGPGRRLHVEIWEGIRYLVGHRLLLTLTTMVAMGRLGSTAVFAVFALYAVTPGPMGLSEPEYGVLFVMFGIGSVLGSVAASTLVSFVGRARMLILAQLTFALGIAVPAFTANPILVGAGFLLGGVAVMAWNITNVSLRQSILPTQLMGRVHASHRFIATVAGLAGAGAAAAVGELIGLPAVFAVGAAIVAAAALGGLVVTEDRIVAAGA